MFTFITTILVSSTVSNNSMHPQCTFTKKIYHDTKCCPDEGASDLAPLAMFPEQNAFETSDAWRGTYDLKTGTGRLGLATAFTGGLNFTDDFAPTAQNYGYERFTTQSGMDIYVKDRSKCDTAVVLEFASGGYLIDHPLYPMLYQTQIGKIVPTINACHVVPHYRTAFSTRDVSYTAPGSMSGPLEDSLGAYKWTVHELLTCSLCNPTFIVGGFSSGAWLSMMALHEASRTNVLTKIPDLVVLTGAHISCAWGDSPSTKRNELSIADAAYPTYGVQIEPLLTEPERMCPNRYSANVVAAMAKKYVIALGRQDLFLDTVLHEAARYMSANAHVTLHVSGVPKGHSTASVAAGTSLIQKMAQCVSQSESDSDCPSEL